MREGRAGVTRSRVRRPVHPRGAKARKTKSPGGGMHAERAPAKRVCSPPQPGAQLRGSARVRRSDSMIVRIWHGRTPRERADEYGAFLTMRAIPDYRDTPGNLDVAILRRDEPEASHFLTVTRWESEDAI